MSALASAKFDADLDVAADDCELSALCEAYRPSGGIIRADVLAHWLQARRQGGFESLARLILGRRILSFEWDGQYWVPLFQFDLRDMCVRPAVRMTLAELPVDFDGWTLAAWFAQPNVRLNDRSPVDLLDSEPAAVLAAAGAERCLQ